MRLQETAEFRGPRAIIKVTPGILWHWGTCKNLGLSYAAKTTDPTFPIIQSQKLFVINGVIHHGLRHEFGFHLFRQYVYLLAATSCRDSKQELKPQQFPSRVNYLQIRPLYLLIGMSQRAACHCCFCRPSAASIQPVQIF